MKNQYTDQGYAEELQQLRGQLLAMAGRVEHMVDASVRSLVDNDDAIARATIAADDQVNQDEMNADQLCVEILATRQPMASDLRFITQCMKMVTDLERIADLAVNVCERVLELNREPALAPYIDIPRMAECVKLMVRDATDAFIERDRNKAQNVIDRDDEVDDLYHKVFRHLIDLMREDPAALERGIRVQAIAKFMERMGDHATNLAEQVIFMVSGEDVRHPPKE